MNNTKKERETRKDRPAVPVRTPHEQLAREAAEWDERVRTPAGFEDAPDAAPRASESKPVSIRLPRQLLELLRRFAEHEGIGYQVLIKRWLDDRVRAERERMRDARAATEAASPERSRGHRRRFCPPSFPMVDRREGEAGHYQQRL